MAEPSGFLGRWSRRKQQTREGLAPTEEPRDKFAAPDAPGAQNALYAPPRVGAEGPPPRPLAGTDAAASTPVAPTLEDVGALDRQSDFSPFVARAVAPEVRNAAMRKLFSDPHFNVMDGLDIYIGDYSLPDPLPAGMLHQMASARALGLVTDEDAQPGSPEAADSHASEAQPHQPHRSPPQLRQASEPFDPRDVDKPDQNGGAVGELPVHDGTAVAQSGVCNAIPSQRVLAAAPPLGAKAAVAHASQSPDVQDADLRLQPDHAARPPGAGNGSQ